VKLNGKLLPQQLTVGSCPARSDEFVVVVLRSGHPRYPPITIGAADHCKPLGQVVASVRRFIE
jgi:hypothetical protein